jgi:hypothetical protein
LVLAVLVKPHTLVVEMAHQRLSLLLQLMAAVVVVQVETAQLLTSQLETPLLVVVAVVVVSTDLLIRLVELATLTQTLSVRTVVMGVVLTGLPNVVVAVVVWLLLVQAAQADLLLDPAVMEHPHTAFGDLLLAQVKIAVA